MIHKEKKSIFVLIVLILDRNIKKGLNSLKIIIYFMQVNNLLHHIVTPTMHAIYGEHKLNVSSYELYRLNGTIGLK